MHYVRSHVTSVPTYFLLVSLISIHENFRVQFSSNLVATCLTLPFILKLSSLAVAAAIISELASQVPREFNSIVEDAKFASDESILDFKDPLFLLTVMTVAYFCAQVVFQLVFRIARIILFLARAQNFLNVLFASTGLIFQLVFVSTLLLFWPSTAAVCSIVLFILLSSYSCPLDVSMFKLSMDSLKSVFDPKFKHLSWRMSLSAVLTRFKVAWKQSSANQNRLLLFPLRFIGQGIIFCASLSLPNFAFLFATYKDFRIGVVNYINEDPTFWQAFFCCVIYFVSAAFVQISQCKTPCSIKSIALPKKLDSKGDVFLLRCLDVFFFIGVVFCFSAFLFRFHAAAILAANLYLLQCFLFLCRANSPPHSSTETGHLKQA